MRTLSWTSAWCLSTDMLGHLLPPSPWRAPRRRRREGGCDSIRGPPFLAVPPAPVICEGPSFPHLGFRDSSKQTVPTSRTLLFNHHRFRFQNKSSRACDGCSGEETKGCSPWPVPYHHPGCPGLCRGWRAGLCVPWGPLAEPTVGQGLGSRPATPSAA